MSTWELIQFGILAAIVMIIAYVARRSQTVGVPPGANREEMRDGKASEGDQPAEDRTPNNSPTARARRSGPSEK